MLDAWPGVISTALLTKSKETHLEISMDDFSSVQVLHPLCDLMQDRKLVGKFALITLQVFEHVTIAHYRASASPSQIEDAETHYTG